MKEEIEVSSIFCPKNLRGQGRATASFSYLISDLTRRLKRPIYLNPHPYDDCGISEEQIRRWYRKLGFVDWYDGRMYYGKETSTGKEG